MKTLKFRSGFINNILSGKKTVTWRLFDDKDLEVGDKIELIDKETGDKFAKAEIIKITEKKLGEVEDKDFEGHEKFESKEDMLKTYREYYGNRVTMDTTIKVIEFKLL